MSPGAVDSLDLARRDMCVYIHAVEEQIPNVTGKPKCSNSTKTRQLIDTEKTLIQFANKGHCTIDKG